MNNNYRHEIDGLRAIAVISVIIFHLDHQILGGGFLGVDVFFVISGYLISNNIFSGIDQNQFSFATFYKKRIKRIIPALLTMSSIVLVFSKFFLYSEDLKLLGWQGLAAIFSYSNFFYFSYASNYWGQVAENSPLLHTWSLSLEEQFYLVFPFLTFFAYKEKLKFKKILITVIILSLISFMIGTANYRSFIFYLLPCRVWELGIGSYLAFLHQTEKEYKKQNDLFSLMGLLMIIFTIILYPKPGKLSPYIILPILGTFLILKNSSPTNFTNKFLANPIFRFTGKISYSLYLWHWPVIVVAHNYFNNGTLVISKPAACIIMLVLSLICYYLVEQPLRYQKNFKAIIVLFLVSTSLSIYNLTQDYDEDLSGFNITESHTPSYNNGAKKTPLAVMTRLKGIKLSHVQTDHQSYKNKGIIKKYHPTRTTPNIVVLGDSHSLMWSTVIDNCTLELKENVSFFGADATTAFMAIPPVVGHGNHSFNGQQKLDFDQARLKAIYEWKPKLVIISCIWIAYNDTHAMEPLLNFLRENDCSVLFIAQPPMLPIGDRNAPKYLSHMGFTPSDKNLYINIEDDVQSKNMWIKSFLKQYSNAHFLDLNHNYIKNGKALVVSNNNVLYVDDDHLSVKGTFISKTELKQKMKELLKL
jgi:peptidoglycan/LPS O-acetylase OafA/YrhL